MLERQVGTFADCVRSTGSLTLAANPNFRISNTLQPLTFALALLRIVTTHEWFIVRNCIHWFILFNVAWRKPFSPQCIECQWKSCAEVEASVCFSWERKRRDASYWCRHRIVPLSLRLTMEKAQFHVEALSSSSSSSWRKRIVSIFWNIYVRIFRMQRLILHLTLSTLCIDDVALLVATLYQRNNYYFALLFVDGVVFGDLSITIHA